MTSSFSPSRLREALGLFKSAIKSGERWTPTCEEIYDRAIAASVALADRLQEVEQKIAAVTRLHAECIAVCTDPRVNHLTQKILAERHASRARDRKEG